MTDAEAPMLSLKERIAALQLSQVGVPPSDSPLPPRPRSATAIRQPQTPDITSSHQRVGNQPNVVHHPQKPLAPPALPARPQNGARPALPPREPSDKSLKRVDSRDSVASTISRQSSASYLSIQTSNTPASRKSSFDAQTVHPRVRAPAYDAANLPALPPKKPESKRPSLTTIPSVPKLPTRTAGANESQRPSLPHAKTAKEMVSYSQIPVDPHASTEAIRPMPRKSALSFGLNENTNTPPVIPNRPGSTPSIPHISLIPATTTQSDTKPPPIPLASRPNVSQLQSSKPQFSTPNWNQPASTSCLKCRDFSGPDKHAARFPRDAIPSSDIGWLSQQLTSPFPSATDKARAIFAWLHYNIDYDVEAFYGGTCRGSTPGSTLASGLAVCEGYAGLFAALCIQAGLESIAIGGNGKGYGHKVLQPGEPVPPFNPNHAWNAVKLENGEWKLVEACWGAGYVQGPGKPYVRCFNPEWFTMDNQEFGLRHFPADPSHFFRPGGTSVTWDEYMIGPDGPGDNVQVYSGCTADHGFDSNSFLPKKKHIRVRGLPANSKIQFQVQRVCEHWDKFKPYVYVLSIGGIDGRKREEVPFQTNGFTWWVSVEVKKLGCSGQTVTMMAVTTIGGRPGRGFKIDDYSFARRTGAVAFQGVASWQLV